MGLSEKLEEKRGELEAEGLKEYLVENWHIPALASIVLIAFYLRYAPAMGMEYLQAADPYLISRMSQHLALEGTWPQTDFMRYFPYNMPTYLIFKGNIVLPAVMYASGFSVFFSSFLEFARFYPAFMGAGTVFLTYFLTREFFDRNAGIGAAFFLAVTSAGLRRTSAGFFDKEPTGVFLLVLSMLFFTRAWKKENWLYGIGSGLSLGLFTVSWGGSQLLWLLYPIVTGIMIFIDQDVRNLIPAYTPTVLLGGFTAAITLPRRFSFDSSLFLLAMAVMGALWVRYLIEELELVERKWLPYIVPSMSFMGLLAAIFSPIYSDWVARKVLSVISAMLGSTGGVIGGTVQENAPPGAAALARNLGSALIGGLPEGFNALFVVLGAWGFMLFSVAFSITAALLMLGRKYDLVPEEVSGMKYLAYVQAVFIGWMVFVTGLVQNLVVFSGVLAVIITATLVATVYFLGDSSFSIMTLFLTGAAAGTLIFSFRLSGSVFSPLSYLTFFPVVAALAASGIVRYLEDYPSYHVQQDWPHLLGTAWIVASIFGAMTRTRLVFLSAFAVSVGAGHGLSITASRLRGLDYSKLDFSHTEKIPAILIAALIIFVGGANLASGYLTSQGIVGSPSPSPDVWEPSMEFLRNAPEGSVTLSWWDYGYHFQSLGRSPSVGDGGQGGYYTQETRAVNMPLAEYLNTTVDRPEDRRFIEKHSADYIWLDHTMIGKFSAVSQIANRDNSQFETISQVRTSGSLQNSLSQGDDGVVARFRGNIGRDRVEAFVPVSFSNTSAEINGPPTLRFSGGQSVQIGCLLTESGRQDFNVSTQLDFCVAEDPFYSLERGAAGGQSGLLFVPEKISSSTFVNLYIQDGYNVDYAEKIPEASNGYIKMWEIEQ